MKKARKKERMEGRKKKTKGINVRQQARKNERNTDGKLKGEKARKERKDGSTEGKTM